MNKVKLAIVVMAVAAATIGPLTANAGLVLSEGPAKAVSAPVAWYLVFLRTMGLVLSE